MASTFTCLTYHIIFSTKYRKPTLTDAVRGETYKYIAGVIANKDSQLIEIGGIDDHVHIVTSCSPRLALADFIRDIKANSSKWVSQNFQQKDFQWQTGYGAFTVSSSQKEKVRKYVRSQAEHHQKYSFEDEFRNLLTRHKVTFDERYLFEDEHHG